MTSSEKKHEDRHEALKAHARKLLVEEGMSGFSIEKIASRSGYSRPTIYQHFRSKDDVLECVALDGIQLGTKMLERALTCQSSLWQRAIAMLLSFEQIAHFHPTQYHIIQSLASPWIARRLSKNVLQQRTQFADYYLKSFTDIFEAAQSQGDLTLRPGTEIPKLTFHTITSTVAIYSAIQKNCPTFLYTASQSPWLDTLHAITSLWEGYGWTTHEDDDLTTIYDEIMRSCFPEYWVKSQTEALAAQVHIPPKNH